jgi:hypothetical protein
VLKHYHIATVGSFCEAVEQLEQLQHTAVQLLTLPFVGLPFFSCARARRCGRMHVHTGIKNSRSV